MLKQLGEGLGGEAREDRGDEWEGQPVARSSKAPWATLRVFRYYLLSVQAEARGQVYSRAVRWRDALEVSFRSLRRKGTTDREGHKLRNRQVTGRQLRGGGEDRRWQRRAVRGIQDRPDSTLWTGCGVTVKADGQPWHQCGNPSNRINTDAIHDDQEDTGRNQELSFGHMRLTCLTGIPEDILIIHLDIQVWSSRRRLSQKLKLGYHHYTDNN